MSLAHAWCNATETSGKLSPCVSQPALWLGGAVNPHPLPLAAGLFPGDKLKLVCVCMRGGVNSGDSLHEDALAPRERPAPGGQSSEGHPATAPMPEHFTPHGRVGRSLL